MAALKHKRGVIDKDRLDLSELQAVEYWMKHWGMTKDIAAELGKKRRPRFCVRY